jgi:hypothetical protein
MSAEPLLRERRDNRFEQRIWTFIYDDMPRQGIERGIVELRRMEQLLEPTAEKEVRGGGVSSAGRG